MSESLKINRLILILIAGILLTSSTSIPFANAQPTPTSLTIAVLSPPKRGECTIAVTLKDESGNPLPNMDIDFYECGSCLIGTNKTDLTGVASLKLTSALPRFYYPEFRPFDALGRGKITITYKFNANFSGTTSYAPSSSVDLYVSLRNYTPFFSGILITVAIIGVVGYIVFRRRKNAIIQPMTASAR